MGDGVRIVGWSVVSALKSQPNGGRHGGLCEPRPYVDGLQVGQGRMANDSTAIGVVPDQVVDVGDVSAVEVHLRATSLQPRPVQLELCRKMPAAQVDGSLGCILAFGAGNYLRLLSRSDFRKRVGQPRGASKRARLRHGSHSDGAPARSKFALLSSGHGFQDSLGQHPFLFTFGKLAGWATQQIPVQTA